MTRRKLLFVVVAFAVLAAGASHAQSGVDAETIRGMMDRGEYAGAIERANTTLSVEPDRSDVLIVLGAPNIAEGCLSPIALSRAQRAIEEYRKWPGSKVVLGGGYGEKKES